MRFVLLYFDGCPTWHQALENLRQALQAEELDMEVSLVRVEEDSHARAVRFQGSPTIRLSGEDLFTRAVGPEQPGEYGISCRMYQTEEGLMGWPTVKMVRDQLRSRIAPKATV